MKPKLTIFPGGAKAWKLNGEYHREDGPAYIDPDEDTEWWIEGYRHREDGPAVINSNYKSWFQYGKYHREDGPSYITSNHLYKKFSLHGYDFPQKEWLVKTIELNFELISIGKTLKDLIEEELWWTDLESFKFNKRRGEDFISHIYEGEHWLIKKSTVDEDVFYTVEFYDKNLKVEVKDCKGIDSLKAGIVKIKKAIEAYNIEPSS